LFFIYNPLNVTTVVNDDYWRDINVTDMTDDGVLDGYLRHFLDVMAAMAA
jgi:hypothetical protein